MQLPVSAQLAPSAEHHRPTGASVYVPLDSWVYAAFDRLAALGYLTSSFAGMRPWTRTECARLVLQAGRLVEQDEHPSDHAVALYKELREEFFPPRQSAFGFELESAYFRFLGIAGTPLRDGYHFAQTITNDYGRRYAKGGNVVMGLSLRGQGGPFAWYVRGEYQRWSSSDAVPQTALQAIAAADRTPVTAEPTAGASRFRLLEGFIAVQLRQIQISFGKQSLWLGPGSAGPLLFSNNAEPVWMLQINRVSPWEIPGVVRVLGPMRWQLFLGQLAGHRFVFSDPTLYGPAIRPQPFLHGEKVSFHPTENFEFGMGVTTIFGGPGMPFTAGNFLRTLSWWNQLGGSAEDAGDHRSEFDFSYRIPKLRRWLTVYGDALVEDEISPIGSSRPTFHPGIYLPRVPHMPKLDLRLEGIYSDVPGQRPIGPIYYNTRYRDGYTNYSNLLASWIGRQGRGGVASATYWFRPRHQLQFAFRHMEVDRAFLQGGHLNDFAVHHDVTVGKEFGVSSILQYERWAFPLLATRPRSNLAVSVQLTFWPRPASANENGTDKHDEH